jgi:hypothetical protein
MEMYKLECYSQGHPVFSDMDSDLSDLGKDELLLPSVYPMVKIKVEVSMILSVMLSHHLLHLLIYLGLNEENYDIICLHSRKFWYAGIVQCDCVGATRKSFISSCGRDRFSLC